VNGRTLSRLLRLRQLEHDAAKVALANANEAKRGAEEERASRNEVLHSLHLPDRAEAAAWLAVTAARQSAAIAVRDSAELVRLATGGAEIAAADWARARAAARGLERLEERNREAQAKELQAREQREQDDRSATRAGAANALDPGAHAAHFGLPTREDA
jgi:flagellar FliJ protein